ncbi:MAG: hypothetical protein JW750_02165, partial [Anaerolineaceae bacterium]|nr:hypothetical protein [Anaerolineaceae bacterium]
VHPNLQIALRADFGCCHFFWQSRGLFLFGCAKKKQPLSCSPGGKQGGSMNRLNKPVAVVTNGLMRNVRHSWGVLRNTPTPNTNRNPDRP